MNAEVFNINKFCDLFAKLQCVFFQLLILFTAMLLIAFEPAFSGKILKKLDKELKKVNDPFFLIICIVIKSFSYIQMGLQKLKNLFADVGTNTVDIKTNAGEIDANYKSIKPHGSRSHRFQGMNSIIIIFDIHCVCTNVSK